MMADLPAYTDRDHDTGNAAEPLITYTFSKFRKAGDSWGNTEIKDGKEGRKKGSSDDSERRERYLGVAAHATSTSPEINRMRNR